MKRPCTHLATASMRRRAQRRRRKPCKPSTHTRTIPIGPLIVSKDALDGASLHSLFSSVARTNPPISSRFGPLPRCQPSGRCANQVRLTCRSHHYESSGFT